MRSGWDYELLEVGEDVVHLLARCGRGSWYRATNIARFDVGENRPRLRAFEVIGDPVYDIMAMAAKLLSRHVPGRRCLHRDKYRVAAQLPERVTRWRPKIYLRPCSGIRWY